MKFETAILPLLIVYLVLYGPQIVLWCKKELSGKELIEIDPRFDWIGTRYPFIQIMWCLLTGLPYVAAVIWFKIEEGDRVLYLIVAWLATVAILDGFVAVRTGVYPVPRPLKYLYVYEDGNYLRRIGALQLSLALVVTIVAILLVL
jgi:hypothetical protein